MTEGPILLRVAVDSIDPPTANPRFEASDLDELVESIKGVGILEPRIGVALGVGSERVRLVAGLRRFTAANRAGLTHVPMIVYPHLEERQELAISLVENLHRKNMSPVESGEAFKKLCETGMTQRQVAAMVGISDFNVNHCIQIATKLVPSVRDACHRGEITQTQAFDLTKWPPKMQVAMLANIGRARAHDAEEKRNARASGVTESRSGSSRGECESALRGALIALAAKDYSTSLSMAERACELLRERRGEGGVRTPDEYPGEEWRAFAAGQDTPTFVFYPERGEDTKEATSICADCLVKSECLEYAIATHETHGIWGGASERQRRRIRSMRRRAAA